MDSELQTALKTLEQLTSNRDSDIAKLKAALVKKDNEINDQSLRIERLEHELSKAQEKITEMTLVVSKLSKFRQTIMDSVEKGDWDSPPKAAPNTRKSESEWKRNIASTPSSPVSRNLESFTKLPTQEPKQTVDGRLFFQHAKQQLSFDEFNSLVWNVKAFNNRQQTKSATLDNVAVLLGSKHQDLYDSFESLLQE